MARITDQELALAAQSDDEMSALVQKYHLFIIRTASAICHKFVTKHDDEYAIALHAFCDAVVKFDPSADVSFDSYAKLLIKNRIIDYLRTESRHSGHLSLEHELENGRDFSNDAEAEETEVQNAAAEEIARLSAAISPYGISFSDLTEASPKQAKTRDICAQAVSFVIKDPSLVAELRRNHSLPMKILEEKCQVPRKTLERHRKYIVTAIEVCLGDFPVISEYLRNVIQTQDEP